jgi:hypothetical protein
MAFEFPRANSRAVFFPTVHIHDGEVHEAADFDHELYIQPAGADDRLPRGWEESPMPAADFVNVEKAKGLVDGELHVYRRRLAGRLKNQDLLV